MKQQLERSETEILIDEVIQQNPLTWEMYKKGERRQIGIIVGKVMKASKGKASPKIVNQILMLK